MNNNTEHTEEQIQDYLSGDMNTQEKGKFEKNLQQDQSLRQEVFLQKRLKHVLKNPDSIKHIERMNSARAAGNQSVFYRRALAMTGIIALALIIGFSVWGAFLNTDSMTNKQVNLAFSIPPNFENQDDIKYVSTADKPVEIKELAQLYEQKKYTEIQEKIPTEKSPVVAFYDHLSNYHLLKQEGKNKEGVEKVIAELEDLSDREDIGDEVKWYLALIYLEENKRDNAQRYLNYFIKKGGSHEKQATQFLEQL